jgi:hypothetical protein
MCREIKLLDTLLHLRADLPGSEMRCGWKHWRQGATEALARHGVF